MAFVQLSNVNVSFGARDLIKSATLTLMEGSRAALAGPNGAGKSTLMKIAVGQFKADSGDIAITKGARISYLPQTGIVLGSGSVFEEAETAFAHIAGMIERQEEVGRQLQDPGLEGRAMARLLEEFDAIGRAVESSGYFRRAERISEVLRGLGFEERNFGKRTPELSGGWQMRLALAKILLGDPDVMLLDEPTNYLDLEARNWLEGFLRTYHGGVLLVSHDRYFLDVTVNEVYELFNGKLTRYPGTFSAYEDRRARELATIFELWERQQEEIQKLEDFIRRFRYKATKAAQVQSRIKMLEKIVPIEIPEGMKHIHFKFPAAPHSGKVTVRLEGIRKAYGSLRVIEDLSLEIERGRKIAFVGPNGAGKSTLMRIVAGVDKDFSGAVTLGSGVEIGYFAQESAESMSSERNRGRGGRDGLPLRPEPQAAQPARRLPLQGRRCREARLGAVRAASARGSPSSRCSCTRRTSSCSTSRRTTWTSPRRTSSSGGPAQLRGHRALRFARPRLHRGARRHGARAGGGDDAAALLRRLRLLPREKGRPGTPPPRLQPTPANCRPRARRLPRVRKPSPLPPRPRAAARPPSWEEEKQRKALYRKLKKREDDILARLEAISGEKKAFETAMALPANYSDGAKAKKIMASIAALEAEAAALNDEWVEAADALSGFDQGSA